MDTVPLNCNGCGAALEVGPGANYATCGHCGARLAVRRTASATYTEVLDRIGRATDAMAGHLATIARETAVERIDREWDEERAKLGGSEPRTRAGAIGMALFMAAFGVWWTVSALSDGAPAIMVVFGLVFVGFALAFAFAGGGGSGAYREAEARYRRRRAEALGQDPPPPAG